MSTPVSPSTTNEVVVAKLLQVQRLRDRELAEHGRRTAELAVDIGSALGCDLDTLDRMFLAGQLHDIGKIGVTESTLWKPAGLNRAEWSEVRSHPEDGHDLVADVVHRDVAAAVLYHHERNDGGGYPLGIDARTLPLVARVVQVADAFDMITAGRPYQPAVAVDAAVEEIERCAGTQFDPEVSAALRRVYSPGGARWTDDGPAETDRVIDLTDHGPVRSPNPASADPYRQSPSMVRLRRSG